MFDFYIAAPVVGLSCSKRSQIDDAILVLEKYVQDKLGRQANIYNPRKLKIPNAWNMPRMGTMRVYRRCSCNRPIRHSSCI